MLQARRGSGRVMAAALLLLASCTAGREAQRPGGPPGGAPAPAAPQDAVVETLTATPEASGAAALGIQPEFLALTAQGNMVDFRYRVVDAEKAKLILRRTTTKIGLVNQKSGRGVGVFQGVGKLSRLKQSSYAPEVGRLYSMVFINAGIFRPGDLATLKVEGFEVRDIPVQ